MLGILKRGLTQVTVWDQAWPNELSHKVDPVEHKLSAAARAFKAHALGAATVSEGPVAGTETLFNLGPDSLRALYSV